MPTDDLREYLDALKREDSYRVSQLLKQSPVETTQLVYFHPESGPKEGPFVRKFISLEGDAPTAYEALFQAQRQGVTFPHIPFVRECYRKESQLVVVSQFVAGLTLSDDVNQWGPSEDLARAFFSDVCDAVMELHESLPSPIIHRDLKPSNIILAEEGVFLIDLGISRVYKDGAGADTVQVGTRAYAPPEQFGFGQTDVRTDVYALGMLLNYMVTGREMKTWERKGPCPQDVSSYIWRVVCKATSFDPDNRYESVARLKREALQALRWTKPVTPSHPQGQAVATQGDLSSSQGQDVAARDSLLSSSCPRPKEPIKLTPSLVVGLIWDGLLLITGFLALLLCGMATVDTVGVNADKPLFVRFVMFYGFIGIPCLFALFAMADRRLLRMCSDFFARSNWKKELVVCIVAMAVIIAVTAVVVLVSFYLLGI